MKVYFQSENGLGNLGLNQMRQRKPRCYDAGGNPVTIIPGGHILIVYIIFTYSWRHVDLTV